MPQSAGRPRKKRRANWPLRMILLGVVASFLIYAIAGPILLSKANSDSSIDWGRLSDRILTQSMNWFIVGWTFFFGACLGSFLNVVAWRVPNGITLLGSSRCPYCLVPIQSHYNFPILGWFWLRGRCAACRLPISKRYFIVEIIAGVILVWLLVFELMQDGTNLPSNVRYEISSLSRCIAAGDWHGLSKQNWALPQIVFAHAVMAYTLLTFGLMKWDRLPTPWIWVTVHGLVVAAIVIYGSAEFAFTSWVSVSPEKPGIPLWGLLILQGVLCGLGLGTVLSRLHPGGSSGLVIAGLIIGMGLGVAATLSVSLMFLIALTGIHLIGKRRLVQDMYVLILGSLFLIQISCWSTLVNLPFWIGSRWWLDLVWLGLLVVGVELFRWRQPEDSSFSSEKYPMT